jgi:hypothetical protein
MIPPSSHCAFARYVATIDPESTAFVCWQTGEWALGGSLCSRLEVPEVWALVKTQARLFELAVSLGPECPQCSIALVEPIVTTSAFDHAIDLHYVASSSKGEFAPPMYVASSLSMHHFGAGLMHPEVRELLGSPQALVRDFGDLSKFFVCRVDGLVVAVADSIVSGGGHTAIQQVFTAGSYRKRGIACSLVAQLTNRILQSGGSALYVCAEDNVASARTAERAGFSLAERLINLRVGQ